MIKRIVTNIDIAGSDYPLCHTHSLVPLYRSNDRIYEWQWSYIVYMSDNHIKKPSFLCHCHYLTYIRYQNMTLAKPCFLYVNEDCLLYSLLWYIYIEISTTTHFLSFFRSLFIHTYIFHSLSLSISLISFVYTNTTEEKAVLVLSACQSRYFSHWLFALDSERNVSHCERCCHMSKRTLCRPI